MKSIKDCKPSTSSEWVSKGQILKSWGCIVCTFLCLVIVQSLFRSFVVSLLLLNIAEPILIKYKWTRERLLPFTLTHCLDASICFVTSSSFNSNITARDQEEVHQEIRKSNLSHDRSNKNFYAQENCSWSATMLYCSEYQLLVVFWSGQTFFFSLPSEFLYYCCVSQSK